MGFKNSFKKGTIEKGQFVNTETGETLDSCHSSMTSTNNLDERYCIVHSNEYMIIDKDAMAYIKSILEPNVLFYVYQMFDMIGKSDMNALHDKRDYPHTRDSLMQELDIARTKFSKLMITLHKNSIISYHDVYISRNKRIKQVLLNPTLARRSKRVSIECRKLFMDLTSSRSQIKPSEVF